MNLHLKRNWSAGTTAQKRSKCSLLARLPLLLAIPMLSAVCCQGQRQRDTARVLMLVSDTLHYSNFTPNLNKENYFDKSGTVSYVTGYSVREKHNTIYLDDNKKPLSKYIIVWRVVVCK